MIYFLDTGGQPQFHDLLSLFLALVRIVIFVAILAHRLDDHRMIGYYEKCKPVAKPQPSALSHLQHTIQALLSQALAQASPEGSAPSLAEDSATAHPSPLAQASTTAEFCLS